MGKALAVTLATEADFYVIAAWAPLAEVRFIEIWVSGESHCYQTAHTMPTEFEDAWGSCRKHEHGASEDKGLRILMSSASP